MFFLKATLLKKLDAIFLITFFVMLLNIEAKKYEQSVKAKSLNSQLICKMLINLQFVFL